ncbi:MAG: ParB/RepB/Spo0J family partition protein [Endomicrobium sp.]|jgi:hypothetical protein|nr:ParB/RepB/Spo0J family partition protein [Endomicrobium sp.]
MNEHRNVLVDFGTIEKNIQKYKFKDRGIEAIPTDKIVGSLGRYNDFSENLLPHRGDMGIRYESIKKGMLSGVIFPPIKVYQVLDNYFIIDGHHRVTAAKNVFNAKYIDAEVLEIDFDFEISPKKTYTYNTESAKGFLIKLEEHFFQLKTCLSNTVLKYPLKVTELVSFGKLYEEIENYKNSYNKGQFQKLSIIYASYHWYEYRFIPAISIIEEEDVLSGFPNRTYTDLYVWIQQHKYYLSQKVGYDVGFDFTAHDFFKKYKKVKGLYLIPSMIRDVLRGIKEQIKDLKD